MCSSDLGSVGVTASLGLTGVEAIGVAGQVIVPLLPNTAAGAVGTVSPDREISLNGVAASGAVGTVSVAPRLISLTGNLASGFTGEVIAVYWKVIDDSENANWQNIDNSQTSSWGTVDTEQTPDWEEVIT